MQQVEELLIARKWAPDCLRSNIAKEEDIIRRGPEGKFKVAKLQSNLLGKKKTVLRNAIREIAPEWFGDETQIILNKNVTCQRHVDRNKGHSWVCWLGDFVGGALCFDDGRKLTEKYFWHKFNGQDAHWNEEHTGTKYSIVLYRSGARKTKIQNMIETRKRNKLQEVIQ